MSESLAARDEATDAPGASAGWAGAPAGRRRALVGLRLGAAAVAALLVTFLVCLFVVLPPRMAHQALHPPRLNGTTTPARYGLAYEDVSFAAQDVALSGWYVPARGEAGVVLVHGFAAERRELLGFVPTLHRAGFDVLLYDQRASGASGGDAVTFGYHEAGDLNAAARFLQTRSGATRVGALGRSQGAAVALLAAGQESPLDAVVADSPYADLEQVAGESAARLFGPGWGQFSAWVSPLILWHAEQQSGLRAADVRPVATIGRLSPRPVLLIHGRDDALYTYQHSEALYAAAGEPRELWLVPGAPHAGASTVQPAEYERRVLAFFARALRPAP